MRTSRNLSRETEVVHSQNTFCFRQLTRNGTRQSMSYRYRVSTALASWKTVMQQLKSDISNTSGPLQGCVWHRNGAETSVHTMKEVFDDLETEAVILAGTTDAFKNINWQTGLHNV